MLWSLVILLFFPGLPGHFEEANNPWSIDKFGMALSESIKKCDLAWDVS